ncbi:MAG: hypothetical protein CFH41_00815 [Alphaproteobacteria bacterium MarineAlpha11_Bin1]|nr:MAG: hypothetical protein CFH41_00815 [Alphaproteobacteria bacterium MarineAlpha11_Bin1]
MTTELGMVAWISGLTILMWLPYILAHIVNVGLIASLTYKADGTPLPFWAERAKRAHYNAIENLVPFAALVFVAHLANATNEATATAAVAYFWLRVAHYFVYVLGIPTGRTITFAGSWIAQLCIFYQIVIGF